MKKFIKYGTIAGAVLVLAGAGITTASLLLGADMGYVNGFIAERLRRLDRLDEAERIHRPENHMVYAEDSQKQPETQRAADSRGENGGQMESTGGLAGNGSRGEDPGVRGSFETGYPEVDSFKIRQTGGSVEISVSGEVDGLTVKSGNGSQDDLIFREDRWEKELVLRVRDGSDYQVLIPAGWYLDEFEAESFKGSLSGNGIRAAETELSTVEGTIVFAQEEGRKLDLDCSGSGTIAWTLKTEQYMEIDAGCEIGEVTLMFPETMDMGKMGYEIECENGIVNFPDFTVEGNQEKRARGTLAFMELEAGRGTISVGNSAVRQE